MSILNLEKYLIVTILSGISSMYCANEGNEEPFFSAAPHRSGLSIAGTTEGSEAVEHLRLLEQYTESEHRRRLASQRWESNILRGIRELQHTESATRDNLHRTPQTSSHTAVDSLRLLEQYAESEHRRRQANLHWRQNISQGTRDFYEGYTGTGNEDNSGLMTTASFIRHQDTAAPVGSASDSDESDDRESPRAGAFSPIALSHTSTVSSSGSSDENEDNEDEVSSQVSLPAFTPARVITPTVVDSDSSRSSQSSSPVASEYNDSEYVSDSEDDEPSQGGIGAFLRSIFSW